VRGIRPRPQRPIVITEARSSGDEEFESRRRRYLIMMTGRALCIIAAAAVLRISGWLSAAFVVGALVLPWTAVIMANDRPPKEALRFRRFIPGHAGPAALPPPDNAAARSSAQTGKPGQPGPAHTEADSAGADRAGAADPERPVERAVIDSTDPDLDPDPDP
jgi:hypothetical protein